jgi:hypothetical protein
MSRRAQDELMQNTNAQRADAMDELTRADVKKSS